MTIVHFVRVQKKSIRFFFDQTIIKVAIFATKFEAAEFIYIRLKLACSEFSNTFFKVKAFLSIYNFSKCGRKRGRKCCAVADSAENSVTRAAENAVSYTRLKIRAHLQPQILSRIFFRN